MKDTWWNALYSINLQHRKSYWMCFFNTMLRKLVREFEYVYNKRCANFNELNNFDILCVTVERFI